jgi:quercetin dioxygenase-like cupin family protein
MQKWTLATCAALAVLISTDPATAQQNLPAATNQTQAIKRTALQRFDVPGAAYETVIGLAEIAPDTSIGRHTHPGPESGYLIEGGFELLVEGEPTRTLKAGDSYLIPPNVVHDARTGSAGAKVIATYVIEKGKPLASPAK